MPPRLAVLAVFLLFGAGSSGAERLRQLAFARLQTSSVGVVAAADVTSCGRDCSKSTPRVFVTSDGHSWRDVTPSRILFQLEDAQFVGRDRGWLVDNDCAAGKAFAYRTLDGGRSWRRAAVRSTNCAAGSRLDLSFADADHGWILDVYENGNAPYPLEKTNDGGATWTRAGRAPIAGAIVFRTAREGWLARADFVGRPQQLYVTLNGGRSWRRRVLRPPRGWERARLFPDLPAFFGRRGVLPVTLHRAALSAVAFYVTDDGGRDWSIAAVRRVSDSVVNRQPPFTTFVPTRVAAPRLWWVVQAVGPLRVAWTSDGGKSWRTSIAAGIPRLRNVEITANDARQAWLTGQSRGRILAFTTNDAGTKWQRLRVPTK